MKIIGLTGRSGSGKSVICQIFAELYDIPSIDCDKLSRSVCGIGMPCTKELSEHFGEKILDEAGALKRRVLAELVFGDEKKTKLLNEITHKYILAACEDEIAQHTARGDSVLILDAPTLFESGLFRRCDAIISVVADDEICLARICDRDGLTIEQAKKRLLSQPNPDFYLANSNYIVYNNGSSPPVDQVKVIAEAIVFA